MWKIAGDIARGRSHVSNNIGCQDRIYSLNNNGVVSISLSDGAGSCKYSDIGAEIATKAVCELLVERFDELYSLDIDEVKEIIILKVIEKIKDSQGMDIDINDYSGTLAFVGIKGNHLISGNIGDSIVGILNEKVKPLFRPRNGEFSNETYFFTSNYYKSVFDMFIGKLGAINGFILMSDGTSESLYNKKESSIASGAYKMINWLQEYPIETVQQAIKDNLEQVFTLETFDDCSIIIAKYIENSITSHKYIEYNRDKFNLNTTNYRRLIKQINKRILILDLLKENEMNLTQIKNKTKYSRKTILNILDNLINLNLVIKDDNKYILNKK